MSRRTLVRMSLSAGTLAFGLVLTEVALQLWPPLYAGLALPRETVPNPSHPVYGWKSPPGAVYRFAQEGGSVGRMNAAGWRDRDHDLKKSAGVYRVLVIGDSFAEALQVDLSQTFYRLLENRLNEACTPSTFEVIAMGKNGYGTAQELLVYAEEGRQYEPDVVVLLFTPVNDFVDNSRRLATGDGHRDLQDNELRKPYFSLQEGRLIPDDSFHRTESYRSRLPSGTEPGKFLLDNAIRSAVWKARQGDFNVSTFFESAVRDGDSPPPIHPGAAGQADGADIGNELHLYRRPLLPIWQEEIQLTWALILELRRRVEADGHRFLLVGIPTNLEVHAEELGGPFFEQARRSHGKSDAEYDLFQPRKLLARFAEDHGIAFRSLLEPLRTAYAQTGWSPFGFGAKHGWGHFNPRGHRVVAQVLFDEVVGGSGAACER